MTDIVELILGALAFVLCAAAFVLGGQVIREAWRGAFKARDRTASSVEPQPPAGEAGREAHR
ncbi:hypothetical protein DBR42_03695 [Pelomonas sp. HMWF004]|nr:hypothetical protein DBR42_03695 [Pelomonas sp. HMWF004]